MTVDVSPSDDRRPHDRRQTERRQEKRNQQDRRKQERRNVIYGAAEARSNGHAMRIHAGQIARANGKVVQVMREVAGLPEYWQCDDGQVYEQRMFRPIDVDDIRTKLREVSRRLAHASTHRDRET